MLFALPCLMSIINNFKLTSDEAARHQYSVEAFTISDFLRLDQAAINALLIFPKNSDVKRNLM